MVTNVSDDLNGTSLILYLRSKYQAYFVGPSGARY